MIDVFFLHYCSERVCWQANLNFTGDRAMNFFSCAADPPEIGVEANVPLEFLPVRDESTGERLGGELTITSPGFSAPYPSNHLCLYSIPQCPDPKDMYYVAWETDNFQLEESCEFGDEEDICLDLVELITPSDAVKLAAGGATFVDPYQEKTLCGNQGENRFFDTSTGPGLSVSSCSDFTSASIVPRA